MKRRYFSRIIAVLCVIVLTATLLAGCGQSSSTSSSSASSSAAPSSSASASTSTESPTATADTADDTVYTLKMHHHQNPGSAGATVAEEWVNKVEENAGGKVDIEIYGAQTLGKATDAWDMAVNDVADISWGFVATFPGQFPISEGASLPMMGVTSAVQGSRVMQKMYETNEDLQKEYEDVHVLFFHDHDPAYIGLAKEASSAEEMKGLQIRVVGDGQTSMIQALGATPVAITTSEIYQSMEKGVIDGYALGLEGVVSFSLQDVTKYLLNGRFYVGVFWMVMNKDVWDSLPDDVQAAFTEASGMSGARNSARPGTKRPPPDCRSAWIPALRSCR